MENASSAKVNGGIQIGQVSFLIQSRNVYANITVGATAAIPPNDLLNASEFKPFLYDSVVQSSGKSLSTKSEHTLDFPSTR